MNFTLTDTDAADIGAFADMMVLPGRLETGTAGYPVMISRERSSLTDHFR
jgi:hypothetical protein